MANFVLIHGAWMGSWVWSDIKQILIKHGHKVITPDLPIDLAEVKYHQYIDILLDIINKQNEKVILVGHSMSGMIISTLGELVPNKIQLLVYLAALLPIDGESAIDIVKKLQNNDQIEIDLLANNLLCMVKNDFIEQRFFNYCCKNDIIRAKLLMRPQSTKILYQKIKLTNQNFGSIKKTYIKCIQDNIIDIVTQNKMIKRQSIDSIHSIDTDHCSFFSKIDELIQILLLYIQI